MRTLAIGRGIALSLALAATLSMAACTAAKPTSSAHPGTSRSVPGAARTASTHAASPPAATPSATPGGVQNLVISSAEKSELTAAYAASIGVPISDVAGGGPMPADTYYAYDPATDTYWAMAEFDASVTAPPSVVGTFQDRGLSGLFRKVGAGPWQVQPAGDTNYCAVMQFFPAAVLTAWALPTSLQPCRT